MTKRPSTDAFAARQELDDVIRLMSHDLRSPVRAMVEVANWIEDDLQELGTPLPGDFPDHLEILRSRAMRLQSLINDLTKYARIGKCSGPFNGGWDDLIGQVRNDIPELANFDLALNLNGAPQIGHEDLALLLTVLLSNATKHHDTGQGQISVDIDVEPSGCSIMVADDGPGIPEDMRDRARGVLTTLKPRDTTEGSGMGLAIAQRIADRYDGALSIGMAPSGRGCAVAIQIPHIT